MSSDDTISETNKRKPETILCHNKKVGVDMMDSMHQFIYTSSNPTTTYPRARKEKGAKYYRIAPINRPMYAYIANKIVERALKKLISEFYNKIIFF